MHEYTRKNFQLYFPHIYENIAEIVKKAYGEYTVRLNDGRFVIYDMIRNTIRYLPNIDTMTKEECMEDFSIRLYKLMVRRGMTQAQLAAKSGLRQPDISRYITGERMPNLYTLRKIARALGCSLDDLTYM